MNKYNDLEFRGFCALGTMVKAYRFVTDKDDPLMALLSELLSRWICKMYTGKNGDEEEIYYKVKEDKTIDPTTKVVVLMYCLVPKDKHHAKQKFEVAIGVAKNVAAENLYFSTLLYLFAESLPGLSEYIFGNKDLHNG